MMTILIAVICVSLLTACVDEENNISDSDSSNDLETLTFSVYSAENFYVDNSTNFVYDTTSTISIENFNGWQEGHLTLINEVSPIKILHSNGVVIQTENPNGNTFVYRTFYTIYSLPNDGLVYFTGIKFESGTSGLVYTMDAMIQYPFENEEEEEYIRNLVLEKDLPENIFAQSE